MGRNLRSGLVLTHIAQCSTSTPPYEDPRKIGQIQIKERGGGLYGCEKPSPVALFLMREPSAGQEAGTRRSFTPATTTVLACALAGVVFPGLDPTPLVFQPNLPSWH